MTEINMLWIFGIAVLVLILLCAAVILLMRQNRRKEENDSAQEEEYIWKKQKAMKNWEIIHRFLPMRMLKLLGIGEDNVQTKELLSEQKELQAAFLCGGISEYQDRLRKMESKKVYELLNEIFSYVIPAIRLNSGIIDCFRNQTFHALFTGEPEDALKAGILISEEILKSKSGRELKDFSIGLCYGTVSAGVVGFGDHLSVLTLSTYTEFGAFLQKIAAKYYAGILVTESYVQKIPDFEQKYNYRLLGVFYIHGIEVEEKIYDVYDGDEVGIRNLKRRTKMVFEKGIHLYLERKFSEARGCFIEVLKADQNDKAARNYLYLCDRNKSMEPAELAVSKIYLEEY